MSEVPQRTTDDLFSLWFELVREHIVFSPDDHHRHWDRLNLTTVLVLIPHLCVARL